jgi:hypothetical protein
MTSASDAVALYEMASSLDRLQFELGTRPTPTTPSAAPLCPAPGR